MYYQTVNTPSKCSHHLWIIKVNKKPDITLPAVPCIYVIKFQLESFSCKAPRLAFSFLPPVRFEIFTAGFSSRIFIFPFVHWLRKSDYSNLAIEKNWRFQNLSDKLISRNKNLKKCTSFEEKKGTGYNRANLYFGINVFSCLSSTKPCLRFLLICFVQEIKYFYQSSLENKVDSRDIMNVSLNILAKN